MSSGFKVNIWKFQVHKHNDKRSRSFFKSRENCGQAQRSYIAQAFNLKLFLFDS